MLVLTTLFLLVAASQHSLLLVQAEDQATKVWGTDINVADVRKNFTHFIRGFREQEGQDEEGVPKFKEEIKYLQYLTDVCSPSALVFFENVMSCHTVHMRYTTPHSLSQLFNCWSWNPRRTMSGGPASQNGRNDLQIVKKDEDCFACDCMELASYSPQLYYNLAEYPREVIPILDDILNVMAQEMRREEQGGLAARDGGEGSQVDGSAATHPGGNGPVINIRPYNLKQPRAIRDLDPNDIEALVQVDGLVTRVSNVMPDMRCPFSSHLLACLVLYEYELTSCVLLIALYRVYVLCFFPLVPHL